MSCWDLQAVQSPWGCWDLEATGGPLLEEVERDQPLIAITVAKHLSTEHEEEPPVEDLLVGGVFPIGPRDKNHRQCNYCSETKRKL